MNITAPCSTINALVGGVEISSPDTRAIGVGSILMSVACLGAHYAITSNRQKEAFHNGFLQGLNQGLEREPMIFEFPKKVSYQSLDGETTITDIEELIKAIGSPEDATTRVGLILKRKERKPEQIEYLRKVQVMINCLPPEEQKSLCDEGQDMINQMNAVIAEYEQQQ